MYNHYFSIFGKPPVSDNFCKDSATRHPRFWRRRYLKGSIIYGHGGHLGQRTATILVIFRFPNLRRLHMKFQQKCLGDSEEKSFENVNGRTHGLTDGRTTDEN